MEGEERRFRAVLEADGTELRWVIARVPFAVGEVWKGMRRLRVRGAMDGVEFRTSLFPLRDGTGHFLLVNRGMQQEVGVGLGGVAEFVLQPDREERPAELPEELVAAFEGDRELEEWTERLSESMRREIGKWIAGVKGEGARGRRAAAMAERLLLAMEGERVTPPILEAMFAREPRARRGWEAMTEAQRRGHLLGIFYYQTPEARERRARKAVDEALGRVGK